MVELDSNLNHCHPIATLHPDLDPNPLFRPNTVLCVVSTSLGKHVEKAPRAEGVVRWKFKGVWPGEDGWWGIGTPMKEARGSGQPNGRTEIRKAALSKKEFMPLLPRK